MIFSVVYNSSEEEMPVIFVFYQTATDWPWLSSGTPKIMIIKFFILPIKPNMKNLIIDVFGVPLLSHGQSVAV